MAKEIIYECTYCEGSGVDGSELCPVCAGTGQIYCDEDEEITPIQYNCQLCYDNMFLWDGRICSCSM